MRTMKDIVAWAERHEGEENVTVEREETLHSTRIAIRVRRMNVTEMQTAFEVVVFGYRPKWGQRPRWKFTNGYEYRWPLADEQFKSPTEAFWAMKFVYDYYEGK